MCKSFCTVFTTHVIHDQIPSRICRAVQVDRNSPACGLSAQCSYQAFRSGPVDYQTGESLKELVRDHFAILKVGPALTFAFREAVFFLAQLEDELFPAQERSNVVQVLDDVMIKSPEHWEKYYLGSEAEKAFKRRYSLSDRVRYYWVRPEVQGALQRLMDNLGQQTLPQELLKQSLGDVKGTAQEVIEWKINKVLNDYLLACGGDAGLC